MPSKIEDQVIEFYSDLFSKVFAQPFKGRIDELLRRRDVVRQIEESADAASQSLTRFFLNERLSGEQVGDILRAFDTLPNRLTLEDIANPNVIPEKLVQDLLSETSSRRTAGPATNEAIYRIALHSVVQVLMLVGPVMAEWQKLNFASTFEMPRQVVTRLNQISDQINVLGRSGSEAGDEGYELTYRDYLLQRFHRVEAGTLRMTTNLDVDLRELFVMPRIITKPKQRSSEGREPGSEPLMNLAAARAFFMTPMAETGESVPESSKSRGRTVLDQIKVPSAT
jgi:hypothetical protein